ncbi:Uncharacterised protein [Mycobacteroides abscessus subsp. abscessus]|uniref:hypothetical protein n=1 Tax=Mycobacteroides abscessus TaxID=36809 RepID=UPI00092B8B66|nr:hypothetical protein [Mycobacteroides abscessus]SIH25447.1 Uncharacterised protein [Mycobacteroides abscessus subsp. abscessus]
MGDAEPVGRYPAEEVALAERASDIRDAVALIRRVVGECQSPRAAELNQFADQLDRHFGELHGIGIAIWAPEVLNGD